MWLSSAELRRNPKILHHERVIAASFFALAPESQARPGDGSIAGRPIKVSMADIMTTKNAPVAKGGEIIFPLHAGRRMFTLAGYA